MPLKPRIAGTFPDALAKIAGELTADGAGSLIGVGRSRIYAAMDADQINHSPLNLDQALRLDVAFHEETGHEGPLLRAYRQQYDAKISELTDGLDPVARLGQIGKEVGDVIQALANSIDPKSKRGSDISRREGLDILKEIDELMRVLEATSGDVRRRAGIEEAEGAPAIDKPEAA